MKRRRRRMHAAGQMPYGGTERARSGQSLGAASRRAQPGRSSQRVQTASSVLLHSSPHCIHRRFLMPLAHRCGFVTSVVLLASACTQSPRPDMNTTTSTVPSNDNPLFIASTLPYGTPPLDRIRTEHFRPAFDAGMAEQKSEIEAIVKDRAAPTFANTIVPMEKSGQLL